MPEAKRKRSWTLVVGLIVLGTLCIAWAGNQWQLHRFQGELDVLAREKVVEMLPPGKGLPGYGGRIASEVVVSKPYALFGAPVGKISVFVEQRAGNSPPSVDGYEFFYARQPDASWRQTESGHCDSEQCVVDGKRVLDAFGEAL